MAESVRPRVEMDGDDIIVSMPGTQFRVIRPSAYIVMCYSPLVGRISIN
jgi:hypothetical protein